MPRACWLYLLLGSYTLQISVAPDVQIVLPENGEVVRALPAVLREVSADISSVLFVGDFRSPELQSRSERFARGLEEAKVAVHRLQEDACHNEKIIHENLMIHGPTLLIYHPYLGHIDQSDNLGWMAKVWNFCTEQGIFSVTLLSEVHCGLEVDPADLMWGAQFVVSPDVNGRLVVAMARSGLRARHVVLPSSARKTRQEVEAARIGRWRELKSHFGLGAASPQAETDSQLPGPDGYLYEVLVLPADSAQCPFEWRDSGSASQAVHGRGLRQQVEEELRRRYRRVRVEGAPVRGAARRGLLAMSKVTVVFGSYSLRPLREPTAVECRSQDVGSAIYDAMADGGFVVHGAREGTAGALVNGTHLALFDPQRLETMTAAIDFYLQHETERERVRRAGQRHVEQHHTVTDRMATLLAEVEAEASGTDARWPHAAAHPAQRPDGQADSQCDRPTTQPGGSWEAEGGERMHLEELVGWLGEGARGVEVTAVAIRELSEAERTVHGARSVAEDAVLVERLGGWLRAESGVAGGVALLRLEETGVVQVREGLLLCNRTHAIRSFALHGPNWNVSTGCFARSMRGAQRRGVGRAVLVAREGGNSWQHFVQDLVWLLQFALEAMPGDDDYHLLLQARQAPNNFAIVSALLGTAAGRVLVLDHECMLGVPEHHGMEQVQCSSFVHASRLYVPIEYPHMHAVHSTYMRPFLRAAHRTIGGYVSSLLATTQTEPRSASEQALSTEWLWFCQTSPRLDSFKGCAWPGTASWPVSTSPIVILSRWNEGRCESKGGHRCLLNEAELAEVLSDLHAAVLQSPWHQTESPHPLELQRGQREAVQVLAAGARPLAVVAAVVREATVLAGAHGGQLFNLLFARRGAVLLELLPGRLNGAGPFSVSTWAQSLGLEVWISPVPGAAHLREQSEAPFVADSTRAVAAVLESFAIPALHVASLSVQLDRCRSLGEGKVAVGFEGAFIDQVLRLQQCQPNVACAAVRLRLNGSWAGEYSLTQSVGPVLRGELPMPESALELELELELELLLVDAAGRSLGLASGTKMFDAQRCPGHSEQLAADEGPSEAQDREGAACLLSFPRSGGHWLRFMVEFITMRPTAGRGDWDPPLCTNTYIDGSNPLNTTDCTQPYKIVAHQFPFPVELLQYAVPQKGLGMRSLQEAVDVMVEALSAMADGSHKGAGPGLRCASLVLVLRDFQECIPQQMDAAGLSHHVALHQDAYLAIVEAFVHFRGPKLFLSFNDLVDSPVYSVKQLSHFLRGQGITVPEWRVKEFAANRDQLALQSSTARGRAWLAPQWNRWQGKRLIQEAAPTAQRLFMMAWRLRIQCRPQEVRDLVEKALNPEAPQRGQPMEAAGRSLWNVDAGRTSAWDSVLADDWSWETTLPMPPAEAEQTLYYLCDGHCGGFGDRLIGMLGVFVLAVLTNRSYRVIWQDPDPVTKWLVPTGAYPWDVAEVPALDKKIDWGGSCVRALVDQDFAAVYPHKRVGIKANMEIFTSLQQNPMYRGAVRSWDFNVWFAKFFRGLFQPAPRVLALAAPILQAMQHRDLICVQARVMGYHWPHAVTGAQHVDDSDVKDLSSLWAVVEGLNASHNLLVASDWDEVAVSAHQLFPGRVYTVNGPVVHLDKKYLKLEDDEEFTRGVDRVVAEFHLFHRCDSFVFSRSGFGELGAASSMMHADKKLFLWDGEKVLRLHTGLFALYKNSCNGYAHVHGRNLQIPSRCLSETE